MYINTIIILIYHSHKLLDLIYNSLTSSLCNFLETHIISSHIRVLRYYQLFLGFWTLSIVTTLQKLLPVMFFPQRQGPRCTPKREPKP
jgi:hypothetical protein